MQIDFNLLPKDILAQIPLSLRINKKVYDINELPNSIQYLLRDYKENKPVEPAYDKVYDIKPEISIYSDFNIVNSKIDLLSNYFKNYLLTQIGTYPFDVNFGCKLKEFLQTKDTSLQRTLLTNEINNIASVIGNDYNSDIIVKSIEVMPVSIGTKEYHAYTQYNITITVEIDKTEVVISA